MPMERNEEHHEPIGDEDSGNSTTSGDVEFDGGRDANGLPLALIPSMRVKVTGVIALYLCTMLFTTYHSQELVGSTVATIAWLTEDMMQGMRNILTREVLVLETAFPLGPLDQDRYDWRDLAAKIEEAEGVSRVSFGGFLNAHYGTEPEQSPTEDDIHIFFTYANLRPRFRGLGIEAHWGRTIHDPWEIVVSQHTSEKLGVGVGDDVDFFDTKFEVVGISIADTKFEERSYPLIMVDFSHLDNAAAYLERVAEEHGVPEDREWIHIHFSLEVYARGEKDVGRAVDSLIELQGELAGGKEEATEET
jgi:hypothetical protein